MSEHLAWDAAETAAAAVRRLVAVDVAGVEDALGFAEVIEEIARTLAAVQQAVAARVDVHELRARLRLSPNDAKSRVRRADALPRLPATAAAQAEGAISTEHVQVIGNAMRSLPAAVDPQTCAAAEQRLADEARQFGPKDLGVIATRLRACLDPDGTLATEEEKVARRELSFARDLDGSYVLRGRLDPEGAEYVRVALDSLAAPAPAKEGTPDPRSPARRQADALVELAKRAIAGGGLPDSGGRPTQILVSANLADLLDRAGLAELSHTREPISIQTALRMACQAEVNHTIFQGGRVLSVGRTRRLATKHQRDALIARDRGCAAPHCDAPPAWTQAHHIIHWAHGGRTDLDNLVLLCGRHHRAVHNGHWTITTTNGTPEVRPPPRARAA